MDRNLVRCMTYLGIERNDVNRAAEVLRAVLDAVTAA
jgi:hypothetical protein